MKERRLKLRLKVMAVLAAVFSVAIAGCGKGEKEEGPEVSVQAVPAAKADIARVVNTEAVIFPILQSAITPKINAPVKKFYVVRGQKVRQGQLLATLENRDLSAAALDNKGAYEQAEATYSTSVNANLPEEVAKSELEVQTSQQELDAAQKLYSSRQDLYKQGALPRKDLDAAAVQLAQARTAYDVAKKHLDGLNAVGKQGAIKSAQGQLTSAKGKLLNAEAQLSYTEIRSPINGYITDRPLYPGEMASTAAPLLTVMDISQIIAKAHIPQSDALLLHKGDSAGITLAGMEKPVTGKVSLISPALDPNSTTVEVWVQATNPDQQLRPGATAQVSITAQTVHDALVVPASALLNAKEDSAQIMVVDAQSQAQSRDVKIGIKTGDQAQIVSGLKPGEMVITEGAYGLPDKTKVKIEKPESATAANESLDKDKDNDDKAKDPDNGSKAKASKDNGNKDKPKPAPVKKDKDKKD
jgi:multidrug efflux pump subunit AcrA (membrane-fusion protein)